MNRFFPEVNKKLGFGCMRLKIDGDEVDYNEFSKMVDAFLDAGFNYFDTAHGYISEKSEIAIKECLAKRYPRERYVLADKLTDNYFAKEEDIRPMVDTQLSACGVAYFDFYLMHALSSRNYGQYKRCRAFEVVQQLKEEGKIRHIGFSFHDKAEVLEQILREQPSVEFVQLQFNYADYEDENIQSRLCYEVCQKYGKPVIVMEPVKGGSLANLPKPAQEIFDALSSEESYASYAVRFAADFDGVMMVLSGMSNIEQMQDNIRVMQDFVPLSEKEQEAITKVSAIIHNQNIIPCTACRYCVDGCPKKIAIPDLFGCMNAKEQSSQEDGDFGYGEHTANGGKASECIRCGKCEAACPQHLEIRKLLERTVSVFEA